MTTLLQAPYPNTKVTSVLPSPKFQDSRAPQTNVLVKRSMLGRVITYVKSGSKERLRLPFELTRLKAIEVENFFRIYYRARVKITLYPGQDNEAVYVGSLAAPLERTAIGRHSSDEEVIGMTLDFLAEKQ